MVLIKINNTNYTQKTKGAYESHWAHWTYEIKSIKSTSIKKTKKKRRVKQQCLHWVQHQVVQIRTRHVKAIVKHWIKSRHNFPTLHVGRQKFCHKIFTKFFDSEYIPSMFLDIVNWDSFSSVTSHLESPLDNSFCWR